ncbi:MAG: Transcriptional regulatorTetR family [Bacillales bacterium]|nr:Transcriptional regulatorTetR family [Bacillales bacterium]
MKVDRKELILEAARTSFAMNGYKGTTMETVAKIAKVGKGTIYTFFTTKEELLISILQKRITDMKVIADEAFESNGSFIEKSHKALYGVLDLRRWHKILATLISEAREHRNPELVAIIERVDSAVISYIQLKLDLMIEQGLIKTCNTEFIAFMLYRLYTNILFDWEKEHPAFSENEIANMVELLFEKGLSK